MKATTRVWIAEDVGGNEGGGMYPDGKRWEKCGGGFLPERSQLREQYCEKLPTPTAGPCGAKRHPSTLGRSETTCPAPSLSASTADPGSVLTAELQIGVRLSRQCFTAKAFRGCEPYSLALIKHVR